jgi:hypothetical protein
MSRQPRLHRDGRRFGIANFADHDDLRILPHQRAQRFWIRKILRKIHLRLRDHRQAEFHRVFHCRDADGWAGSLHQMIKRGINRRRLARTRRAGEQNQSTRLAQQFDETRQRIVIESERRHVETAIARIKDAHDDLLAARGGENGNALLHSAEFRISRRVAFLRQTGLIRDQIGQHLEAPGNLVHQIERQMHQFRQHTVEPDAHRQRAFPRLDVDVARSGANGVNEQIFDEHTDFNTVLGGLRLKITNCFAHNFFPAQVRRMFV